MSMTTPLLIYAAGWLPMLAIAIANGTLRELGYGRFMKELHAHQLSSLTAILAFYAYTYCFELLVPLHSTDQALSAGTVWLLLTLIFEFLFGHFAAGNSWKKLLSDYNIFKGRLWTAVLISIFLAPLLFFLR